MTKTIITPEKPILSISPRFKPDRDRTNTPPLYSLFRDDIFMECTRKVTSRNG